MLRRGGGGVASPGVAGGAAGGAGASTDELGGTRRQDHVMSAESEVREKGCGCGFGYFCMTHRRTYDRS